MELELQPGDVVQIDPQHDPVFGACLMVVTEVKSWGAVGYVRLPKHPEAVQAFYRCPNEKMLLVGRAQWVDRGALAEELT